MDDLKIFLNSISPLTNDTWAKVSRLFYEMDIRKNGYFIEEGEIAKRVAFLKKGVVRAFHRNSKGVEYNKTFFIAPALFGGYSSLITGQPSQIIQQALTDCHLLVAAYHDLTKLYDDCPDLERMTRRLAEQYFIEKEQREVEIVLLDADKRYQLFQHEFGELEQLIPQYHIASYLGITPTQLSRIRKARSKR